MHRTLSICAVAFFAASAQAQSANGARRAAGDSVARPRPTIGAVAEFVADLSTYPSALADSARFGIRQVEFALQAPIDARLRADLFVTLDELHRIALGEAFITAASVPVVGTLRAGRFLLPVGLANTVHLHDLPTIEQPYIVQKFLAPRGLAGTGLTANRAFAPFGFRQELTVSWLDRFGADDSLRTPERASRYIDGMGYAARLRNAWHFTPASEFELSASGITGKRPTSTGFTDASGVNAVNARQTLVAADFAWTWTPLALDRRSVLLQGEFMRQVNDKNWLVNPGAADAPKIRDYEGWYLLARWQLGATLFAGARWDRMQDPQRAGAQLSAGSGILEWRPGTQTRFLASYERRRADGANALDRVLVEASFAVGAHGARP